MKTILLALIVCLALAGCGKDTPGGGCALSDMIKGNCKK